MFIEDESDYRKLGKNEMEEFINKNLGDFEISEGLRLTKKDDLLVSYDLNSLYPSAEADKDSKWPAIETAYPFEKFMNNAVCELFKSGGWDELNTSAFLTVKYHNPENLMFQHIPIKEKVKNSYKNNRIKEINRS